MENMEMAIFILLIFACQPLNAVQRNSEILTLPDDLVPIHYDLSIITDLKKDEEKFRGTLNLKIKCVKSTDVIILHQANLVIESGKVEVFSLKNNEKIAVEVKDEQVENNVEKYTILLKEPLQKDTEYKVKIIFSRSIHSQLFGLAYNKYHILEEPSTEKTLLYSKINAFDARLVFPCFDRLDMKATYKIEIGHSPNFQVITNSMFEGSDNFSDQFETSYKTPKISPSQWKLDKFVEITKPISTFSVAIAVGDFTSKEINVKISGIDGNDSNVKIRISVVHDNILNQMDQILEVFQTSFLLFSSIFKVPYELGKIDIIAVPDSFLRDTASYGVIFLQENRVLAASTESSNITVDKYSMFCKICNTMSRQWFGHIVTMSSWNTSWFHAGLNTFLEADCVKSIFPTVKPYSDVIIMLSFLRLLETEERGKFSPIVSLGSDSTYIIEFDDDEATLQKVHHTIRMLTLILNSRQIFVKSVLQYVQQFKYKNSNLRDIWNIFTKVINEENKEILPNDITVEKIMQSWLLQKGHPLVTIYRNSRGELIISQEPFQLYTYPSADEPVEEEPCWIILIHLLIYNEKENKMMESPIWLTCDNQPLTLNVQVEEKTHFFANMKFTVPVRLTYNQTNWELIIKELLDPSRYFLIDSQARMHMITDMFALAKTNKLSYTLVFNAMRYLTQEAEYFCWKVALREFLKIRSEWTGTKLFEPYQRYIRNILRPIFNEKIINIEKYLKEDNDASAYKYLIIQGICTFDDKECREFSEKQDWLVNKLVENGKLISNDLAESVYCQSMKYAKKDRWDSLFDALAFDQKNRQIINALGCSTDIQLLNKLLKYGMNEMDNKKKKSHVSSAISYMVFSSLSSNVLGYPQILNYLIFNINEIDKKLFGGAITVENFIAKALDFTRTKTDFDKLVDLYPVLISQDVGKKKILEESKLKAEANLLWFEKNENQLVDYFNDLKYEFD